VRLNSSGGGGITSARRHIGRQRQRAVRAAGRPGAAAVVLVALAALPALAACTSGDPQAAPSASPSAMTDAQIQVLVNDLVQCIRDNGAPGMPDVTVRDGKVEPPDENAVDEATKTNVETAMEACKSVRDRIPPSVLEEGQQEGQRAGERRVPTAEDVPALRQWAKCIRENGIPEWPDPLADGSFPLTGTPLESEGKSPRLMAAWEACKQHWDGGITAHE
jgi:hypothetical protein